VRGIWLLRQLGLNFESIIPIVINVGGPDGFLCALKLFFGVPGCVS